MDEQRFPPLATVAEALGGAQSTPVPIAADCTDGFLCAAWMRPLSYLDETVRANISSFALLDPADGRRRARAPRARRRRRHVGRAQRRPDRASDEADFGYRLLVAELP